MKIGTWTPWGAADFVKVVGDGITLVTTPGHGGLRLYRRAVKHLPSEVAATFINGPGWAEEDCEAVIALAILHKAGIVTDPIVPSVPELYSAARRTATTYTRYSVALNHIPA